MSEEELPTVGYEYKRKRTEEESESEFRKVVKQKPDMTRSPSNVENYDLKELVRRRDAEQNLRTQRIDFIDAIDGRIETVQRMAHNLPDDSDKQDLMERFIEMLEDLRSEIAGAEKKTDEVEE